MEGSRFFFLHRIFIFYFYTVTPQPLGYKIALRRASDEVAAQPVGGLVREVR